MHEHPHSLSMSERADRLEEEKMHEMERIITRSTLAHLMDGNVKMDTSVEMRARHPGKFFLMGDDPRLPPMPEKPTVGRLFPSSLRFHSASAAKRDSCAQRRPA
jgi:hypothetical protein